MNTIRTFIAIELETSTQKILDSVQADLKKTGADASWVKPDHMHLTLKFLGETPVDKIDAIAESIGRSLNHPPFIISLSGVGAYPTIERPQIVWVGIEQGKNQVCEVVNGLEESLAKLKIRKEKRTFDPHITLGRVRSGLNRFALFNALKDYPAITATQNIRRILFFKSTLTSGGPIYEILKSFLLLS